MSSPARVARASTSDPLSSHPPLGASDEGGGSTDPEVALAGGAAPARPMLDALPHAVFTAAPAGEIVFANGPAAELFAMAADDLTGRSVDELLPQALRSAQRAHRARCQAEVPTQAPTGGPEVRTERTDGTQSPVEASLRPFRLGDNGFVAAVCDDTATNEADEHMRRVLRTFDACDDGMFIFEASTLRYTYVSDGAVRLSGYSDEELRSMTPLHLIKDSSEDALRRLIGTLLADGTPSLVTRSTLMHKDGSEVTVETTMRATPTGRDGTIVVTGIIRDMTARVAAEEATAADRRVLLQTERNVAVADDRERIARDLHETVIQPVFATGLNLQAAMVGVAPGTRARLQTAVEGLDHTIKEVRRVIFSLQDPTAASRLRLRLADVISDATDGPGIHSHVEFQGAVESVSDAVAESLVAVLGAVLSNVARHAHASSVGVTVVVDDDVTLTVVDDGVRPSDVGDGGGLATVAHRATVLGGTCTSVRQTGGGTLLTWRVPSRVGTSAPVDVGLTGSTVEVPPPVALAEWASCHVNH